MIGRDWCGPGDPSCWRGTGEDANGRVVGLDRRGSALKVTNHKNMVALGDRRFNGFKINSVTEKLSRLSSIALELRLLMLLILFILLILHEGSSTAALYP